MFKGVPIGVDDINGREVYEGDTVRFKSLMYQMRVFVGVVAYHPVTCSFYIQRGVETSFNFGVDLVDLEIIDTQLVNAKIIETLIDISIIAGNLLAVGVIKVDDSRQLVEFIKQLSNQFEQMTYDHDDYMTIIDEFAVQKLNERYGTDVGEIYMHNEEFNYEFVGQEAKRLETE